MFFWNSLAFLMLAIWYLLKIADWIHTNSTVKTTPSTWFSVKRCQGDRLYVIGKSKPKSPGELPAPTARCHLFFLATLICKHVYYVLQYVELATCSNFLYFYIVMIDQIYISSCNHSWLPFPLETSPHIPDWVWYISPISCIRSS